VSALFCRWSRHQRSTQGQTANPYATPVSTPYPPSVRWNNRKPQLNSAKDTYSQNTKIHAFQGARDPAHRGNCPPSASSKATTGRQAIRSRACPCGAQFSGRPRRQSNCERSLPNSGVSRHPYPARNNTDLTSKIICYLRACLKRAIP